MLYYYVVKQHLSHQSHNQQLKTIFSQGVTDYKFKKRSHGKALTLTAYQTTLTINNLNDPHNPLSFDDVTFDTIHWFLKSQ